MKKRIFTEKEVQQAELDFLVRLNPNKTFKQKVRFWFIDHFLILLLILGLISTFILALFIS